MTNNAETATDHEVKSVFESNLPLEKKLERARTELLDLSARNRLLNVPRSGKAARVVEVVDEISSEIYRLLVEEARVFTFLAGRSAAGAGEGEQADDPDVVAELAQPEDDEKDERGIARRHSDTKLQTRLTPAGLQKRLLDMYYDARTLEEEQGVNILFLALGTLKWIDPLNAANIRYAPLVLIPVALERGNVGEKFKLRWRQEDPAANLSLEAYLDRAHGIKLPAFDAGEGFDPFAYMSEVAGAVQSKAGWEVAPNDIVLGFFSFAKFLMYRDLDPEVWPPSARITDQPLIRSLLADGFEASDDLIPEDASIDAHIPPADMLHIVDSDSSQSVAVHEVRNGRDLVIQGPPGTGKSQTIANIIGSAIADGKTVLFVAEKMAALEVVKRRLDSTGVGDACLELHSNKANKRLLLDELRRTWELGSPRGDGATTLNARITEARDRLNDHAMRMHEPHLPSGLTPYQVIGHLTRLRDAGVKPNDVQLEKPESWTWDGFKERDALLRELAERVDELGLPADHPWCGVGLQMILAPDVARLVSRISELLERLVDARAEHEALAIDIECNRPTSLAHVDILVDQARRLACAPALTPAALASDAWSDRAAVEAVIGTGEELAGLRARLDPDFVPGAWEADVATIIAALDALPADFTVASFGVVEQLVPLLAALKVETCALAEATGREAAATLEDAEMAARIGEHVAAAPEASSEAFAADLWDREVERAADLADAVATLEAARREIAGRVTNAAWSIDLAPARGTLASHGSSFFRVFSGEWRSANRLVKSLLVTPDLPLDALLPLLDAVARGQGALKAIKDEDAFGRAAFGADWRGERSGSGPLIALVEWMRSLRSIGRDARLIAAARPARSEVRVRSERIASIAGNVRGLLLDLSTALGAAAQKVLGNSVPLDRTGLAALQSSLEHVYRADSACTALFKHVPASLPDRLERLAELRRGQELEARLLSSGSVASLAFDAAWSGPSSDWPLLRKAANWVAEHGELRMLAARLGDSAQPLEKALRLRDARDLLANDLKSLFASLRLDVALVFGTTEVTAISLARLAAKFTDWIAADEWLSKWVAYRGRSEYARALGLEDLMSRLHSGRIQPADLVSAYEMSYFEAIFAEQVMHRPEIGSFDGDQHNRVVRDFALLDRQRISASSVEVVRAHHKRIPPVNGGTVGPLGTLRSEMARRRGHMPIRQLMQRAGPAVQALKPVMMMSPLSVAQFLPPGGPTFDLLVMDEASQIQPVDALGAIARCRQVVVVGDPQQLPPTAFFAKMTGAAEDDEEQDSARVADIESILGLFTARGLPKRMLRWHYRSRHQSLIAVSNKQFYESKLFIVPSPYTAEAGMGLRFHHVQHGIFETGSSRTNPVEAKIVAQAVIDHARHHRDLSLGVAAFSAAQRRAIQDQVELLRRQLPPEEEAFFQSHPAEPFFIKNLENVQGDERDVIFISVGYGPSVAGGKPAMRFGPLGSEGGERRLNVLISRAKRRCEVFSSITDEDIDPDFAASRKGVFAFRLFLHFARTGRLSMAERTGRDHDSVFEEQVAKALLEQNYQVHRQVGIAGFFIDLAIGDPELPGRYILGIECDGEAYHDSRSARDRDRLRQAVLEDHGWIIHRIWSADWFQRPKEQLERTIAAIEAAKLELASRATAATSRAVPYEIVTVEREDVTEISLAEPVAEARSVAPYCEARLTRPRYLDNELHEVPRATLSMLVEQVVEVEGPVHADEVVSRIREAWGLKRSGARIQEAIHRAIAVSVRTGKVVRDGDFLNWPGRQPIARDRSQVRSANLRKPECLPPDELAAAIVEIVRVNYGATDEEVAVAASRVLGFKAASSQLRDLMRHAADRAIRKEWLTREGGNLVLGPEAPSTSAAGGTALLPLL
jgi:very-short-patch-repair endonuclease